MYARVNAAPGRVDLTEESLAVWREHVLPAAREQPGFRALLVLGDRGSGKSYAITLWETQADAERSLDSEYMRRGLARLAPYIAGTPTQEHLEVLLHAEL
jgi:quinol monooxygenase YgiN